MVAMPAREEDELLLVPYRACCASLESPNCFELICFELISSILRTDSKVTKVGDLRPATILPDRPLLLPSKLLLRCSLNKMGKDASAAAEKRKGKPRAVPSYAKAADLRDTVKKGSKAQGTVQDYEGCLRRAERWLPGQLERLRKDQEFVEAENARERAASNASFTFNDPDLPANAEKCFHVPMKCTPYMICLFLISECVSSPEPKGDSVLKSIRAAFIWRFELLYVNPLPMLFDPMNCF